MAFTARAFPVSRIHWQYLSCQFIFGLLHRDIAMNKYNVLFLHHEISSQSRVFANEIEKIIILNKDGVKKKYETYKILLFSIICRFICSMLIPERNIPSLNYTFFY